MEEHDIMTQELGMEDQDIIMPDMLIEGGEWTGSKRSRRIEEEEEEESIIKIKDVYTLIRDRTNPQDFKISLDSGSILDPPNIDRFLAFTINSQKENIDDLTNKIFNDRFEFDDAVIEMCTKDLAEMITTDPRLGSLLEHDFLKFLFRFLGNPKLQLHAVVILKRVVAYSRSNKEVVMQYMTPSIIVNLIRSEDRELRKEAFWLLHALALAFPDHPEIKGLIEATLDSLTSFLIDVSSEHKMMLDNDDCPDHEVIYIGSMTLAVVCQVHPHLPRDKLGSALLAIRKLLLYESEDILSKACFALAYLCDGRQAMVVEHDYFNDIIDRLIVVIDSDLRAITIAGLVALGSIVRWGSDYNIEVIIDKKGLWGFECLLREIDKYYVMEACWILSNITARKQNHIQAVIDCECIDSLAGVLKNYNLLDVRKEAAWAILNAIYRGSTAQIKCLRKKCVKPLWDILEVCKDDSPFVCACLEGLVTSKVLKVKSHGEPMNYADFEKYLVALQWRQFQLVGIEGLTQSKKLWTTDMDDMVFHLTCTF